MTTMTHAPHDDPRARRRDAPHRPAGSAPWAMSAHRVEELTARDLTVDPTVQRNAPPEHVVVGLARRWDRGKTGVLTASWRADGNFYVIDGQSRMLAALRCDPDYRFVVRVHEDLTREREIDLFEALNKSRRPVAAVELLRLRVNRGREPYATLGIELARRNLRLGAGNDRSLQTISAAQPLEWLVTRPNGVRCVGTLLDAVVEAYPGEGTRWRGVFLGGVARVVYAASALPDGLNYRRLVKTLQWNLPRFWEQRAQERKLSSRERDRLRGAGSSSLPTLVEQLVTERYNARLADSRRIPEPWNELRRAGAGVPLEGGDDVDG